jgi:hypothetical protein
VKFLLQRLKVDGPLDGATLGHMLRLLAANDVRDAHAWGLPRGRLRRLAKLLLIGARNSCLSLVTDLRFGAAVRAARVEAPVFVLGYWRSGTTHLHNLFALDPRLACPNHYEVYHPRTFLLTEDQFRKTRESANVSKREQDNVPSGPLTPAEDSFAVAALTIRSTHIGTVFPSNAARFERYLRFEGEPERHVDEWRNALGSFLRRLTVKYPGRTLVLKSPDHTARIKLLLDLFPDARFVHIHRNPFEVFQSAAHTGQVFGLVSQEWQAQIDNILAKYVEVQEAFFRERDLIPPDRFCEIAYDDLTADPIGRMRAIYDALRLPDFAEAEPAMRDYLASVSGYARNDYAALDPVVVERITKAWRPYFEAWGYPTTPARASAHS